MKTKEFLELLPDLVREQLPEELTDFQIAHRMSSLLKLYYDRPAIHYEVHIQRMKKEVELGLHFEGQPDSNLEQLELLSRREDEIRQALGADVEIAQWDRGWTRAHETLILEPLDGDFLVEVSFKLSAMIRALEPILRA